jgi:hypothetical protein
VQIAVDVAITGLLLWWIARRIGGSVAGALALAAWALCPWTAFYPATVLTETLATAFTVGVVALLRPGGARAGWRLFAAGLLCGLGVLLRPDGLLLAVAFVPYLLAQSPWKARVRLAGLALLGFTLVYGGWPARNLVRFGSPHWIGTNVTVHREPLEHGAGYRHWLASWAEDDKAIYLLSYCFYDAACPQSAMLYPATAFTSSGERALVEGLLQQRQEQGIDRAMSDAFDALAARQRARHPFRVLVGLPLLRSYNLWVNEHLDLLRDPRFRPWRSFYDRVIPHHAALSALLFFGALAGGALLLARRATRVAAAILVTTLAARTFVLAWTYYVEPRYLVEVTPFAWILLGAGAVEAARLARASLRIELPSAQAPR